jgi:hypothetical protein
VSVAGVAAGVAVVLHDPRKATAASAAKAEKRIPIP